MLADDKLRSYRHELCVTDVQRRLPHRDLFQIVLTFVLHERELKRCLKVEAGHRSVDFSSSCSFKSVPICRGGSPAC